MVIKVAKKPGMESVSLLAEEEESGGGAKEKKKQPNLWNSISRYVGSGWWPFCDGFSTSYNFTVNARNDDMFENVYSHDVFSCCFCLLVSFMEVRMGRRKPRKRSYKLVRTRQSTSSLLHRVIFTNDFSGVSLH